MTGDADAALEAELQRLNDTYTSAVAAFKEGGLNHVQAAEMATWERIHYLEEHPALEALAQRRYDEHQAKVAKFSHEFREHNVALLAGRRSRMSQPGRLPPRPIRPPIVAWRVSSACRRLPSTAGCATLPRCPCPTPSGARRPGPRLLVSLNPSVL